MKGLLVGALALVAIVAGAIVWHRSAFPQTTRNVLMSAIVEIDGRQISGSAVWELTYEQQFGLDAGRNTKSSSNGNAVALRLYDGQTLFISPRASYVRDCLRDVEAAKAFAGFVGCQIYDAVKFVFADQMTGVDEPRFGRFAWKNDGMMPYNGATTLDAASATLQQRGFRMIGLRADATGSGTGSALTETYAWVLALPRSDCGRQCSQESAGTIYANSFTTLLPNGNANPF